MTYLVPGVDIVVERILPLLLGAIVGDEGGVVEGIEVDAVDFGGHGRAALALALRLR